MHGEIRQRSPIHFQLIAVILAIAALGVMNVYSAARMSFPGLWKTQIIWLAIGTTVALAALAADYRSIERVAYPLYAAVSVMLVLVLVIGKKVYGARRWLALGVGNIQPSEIMKIAIIFVLAKYFADEKREQGYTIRDLIRLMNVTRPVGALALLIVAWRKNVWLRDPVGELARLMYARSGGHEPIWDGSLFVRASLITLIVIYLAIGAYLYNEATAERLAIDDRQALRQRAWAAIWIGPPLVLSLLLFAFWQSEFLGDPKAVVLGWLINAGAPSGSHAVFEPVIWFRLVLLFAVVIYLLSAVYFQLKKGVFEIADALAPIDLVLVPMVLILVEPDLGTAMLIGAIAFSIILFVGMRWTSVVLLAVSGVGLAVLSWFALLKDYQKRRVLTFLDPEADALGSGYHALQSIIAVGSGKFLGKGFASGTQSQLSFLPEQHTDFAFSVWSEEHGFVGCLVLITLYLVLVVIAVGIAAQARDKFGALLVTGFTALVFWQAFVNMGMVTGLLPVVGVPLPLFSYGGSSLLTVMVGIGIMLNVAYRRYSF